MGLEVGQSEENLIDIFFGHKGIVGCFTRLATVSQANFLAAFPHPRVSKNRQLSLSVTCKFQ